MSIDEECAKNLRVSFGGLSADESIIAVAIEPAVRQPKLLARYIAVGRDYQRLGAQPAERDRQGKPKPRYDAPALLDGLLNTAATELCADDLYGLVRELRLLTPAKRARLRARAEAERRLIGSFAAELAAETLRYAKWAGSDPSHGGEVRNETCGQCGGVIRASTGGRRKQRNAAYCSDACRQAAYRARKKHAA